MRREHYYPMMQALFAATLFGASAPLAKLLLGEIGPIPLAAFLYLGSGLGMVLYKSFQRDAHRNAEAKIGRNDWGWLAGAVFAGGVAAPILLLFSLRTTPSSTGSLLLNFEAAATTLIAVLIFKEALSSRALWAIICITFASILLSWNTSGQWGFSVGALGIVGACILWGIDNNLTRNISAKDPLMIVMVKGLGAGSFSLVLALILGSPLPAISIILGATLLGSLSYGLSIVLFIHAMRGLGAARTSALFGTAPLIGVVLSFILFQETISLLFVIALLSIAVAIGLLLVEEHRHRHVHEVITHEHRHRHDDGHHDHDHPGMVSRNLMHSHVHTHERIEHEHPHMPDIHHRHSHNSA